MKILYYYWTENCAADMIATLTKLGHKVNKISFGYTDYDSDPVFEAKLGKELRNGGYDCIFSFDFFPIISKEAERLNVPYVSWIYDMPHSTLFSPQLKNRRNHIFVFDKVQCEMLKEKGYPCHIYHMPLPVNTTRIVDLLGAPPKHLGDTFEVSFVGSLYEKCLYNQIKYLPEYVRGYLDGIIEAQQKIYGYNIVPELLNADVLSEVKKYVGLEVAEGYDMTYKDLFEDILQSKITSVERIKLLNQVARFYPLTLFSGSGRQLVHNAQFGGTVDYVNEMPAVFRSSKINLNITLRSIVSGIPLRGMDIMGAGGFLLSNYQPELAELFVDGEDCVLFGSEADMLDKIEYYLTHDKEREEIACNGFRKVRELYSYEVLVETILKTVFEG